MNLTPQTTLIDAIKSGLIISSPDGWIIKAAYEFMVAEVESQQVKMFPLSDDGLEQALGWVEARVNEKYAPSEAQQ